MNIYPIQTNFKTGVLSPRFWARSDVEEYRSGVKDCNNMIATRHGPMESRFGTLFVQDLQCDYARPFGFQLIPNKETGEAFTIVACSDGSLRVIGATGSVNAEEETTNGSFSNSLQGWNKIVVEGKSSVSWASGTTRLEAEPKYLGEKAGVTQQINLQAGTENDERTVKVLSDSTGTGPIIPTVIVSVGTTSGGAEIKQVATTSNNIEFEFNPAGATTIFITVEAQQRQEIIFEPELEVQETYKTRLLFSVSVGRNIAGAVEFTHPWSESDIQNLYVEMSPNENSMYFVCQNQEPQKLTFDLDTQVWNFAPVQFVGAPADWEAGNYPTCLTFFQGRSWWSGVESKPQTFWASKPNDDSTAANELEDLTIGANADDGLEFTLSRSGRIRWLEGGRNLIIGSTSGEYLATSQTGAITPDDIFVLEQSAEGGAAVNSLKVGNIVLFVSGDGRKLLGTRYYEDQNQWRAQELSFTAESITLNKRITQIFYARNPESIIWCLLDDGSLIGCTYDPFNNIIGWHKHTIAYVQGISVSEEAGYSILYATVRRVINGVEVTYLERLGGDYMDSYINTEAEDLNILVPHLAGQTVKVKIDDAQHPDVVLDELGAGTLDYTGNKITVGLSLPMSVTTLEPDYGSQAGTAMGFAKRYNEITARVYSSALPMINGQRPKVRFPQSPMNYREPNRTGDVTVKNLGVDNGEITISQDLPYKLTITGIFGKLGQNKL